MQYSANYFSVGISITVHIAQIVLRATLLRRLIPGRTSSCATGSCSNISSPHISFLRAHILWSNVILQRTSSWRTSSWAHIVLGRHRPGAHIIVQHTSSVGAHQSCHALILGAHRAQNVLRFHIVLWRTGSCCANHSAVHIVLRRTSFMPAAHIILRALHLPRTSPVRTSSCSAHRPAAHIHPAAHIIAARTSSCGAHGIPAAHVSYG
ncbi:unnamed protein product [Pleuronectes platessa]|uniref:Uncharacterized protein n=1 Tax=Pleuronectes platessa TaxID=8262 RepID=A0A9N7V7A9_PLEPL|nr:unnamed protein product [Pleuronectes platessa]